MPIWQNRISPVFDVAGKLFLVDVEGGQEVARTEERLTEEAIERRARRVAQLGANVLICGAISRPLHALLSSAGVEVIPQTCGEVEEVLGAFVAGRLIGDAFVMPGCCGRRRRFRGGRGHGNRRGRRL